MRWPTLGFKILIMVEDRWVATKVEWIQGFDGKHYMVSDLQKLSARICGSTACSMRNIFGGPFVSSCYVAQSIEVQIVKVKERAIALRRSLYRLYRGHLQSSL